MSTKLTFCETSNQKKDFTNDSAYRYNHHHQQHQHQHQQGPPSKSPSIIMATTLPPYSSQSIKNPDGHPNALQS
jgi:hypothetical protein